MITHEPVSENIPCSQVTGNIQHFVGGFRIDLPCIISSNKNVYVQDLYDLVDFLDNGEFCVRTVKFWHAYLRGYQVTLILLDLKSGELLKRSHRINNDTLPCDWVLVADDLFKSTPDNKEQLLNDDSDRN